jgi:hypothetical protein
MAVPPVCVDARCPIAGYSASLLQHRNVGWFPFSGGCGKLAMTAAERIIIALLVAALLALALFKLIEISS